MPGAALMAMAWSYIDEAGRRHGFVDLKTFEMGCNGDGIGEDEAALATAMLDSLASLVAIRDRPGHTRDRLGCDAQQAEAHGSLSPGPRKIRKARSEPSYLSGEQIVIQRVPSGARTRTTANWNGLARQRRTARKSHCSTITPEHLSPCFRGLLNQDQSPVNRRSRTGPERPTLRLP